MDIVFTYLHLVSDKAPMPKTLTTIFARLKMRDGFKIHPICFKCHHIFEPDVLPDELCPACRGKVWRPLPGEEDVEDDDMPELEVLSDSEDGEWIFDIRTSWC